MNRSAVTDEQADIAIAWFVRLRADDVTESERENFFQWLRQARVHQQAFVEILHLWEDMSVVRKMEFDELRPFPQIWELKQKVEASA